MNPESKFGLEEGDGGLKWGLFEIVKTHFETIVLYPFCLAASLAHNPRAVFRELLTNGPMSSYRALYGNQARGSVYWASDKPGN